MNARPGKMRVDREWLVCSLVFLVSSLIFLNSDVVSVTDSKYTLLLSEQIVDHGSFQLDEHFWKDQDLKSNGAGRSQIELPRYVKKRRGHLYYVYPYGTSILSTPFVLVYRSLGRSVIDSRGEYKFDEEKRLQKEIAP